MILVEDHGKYKGRGFKTIYIGRIVNFLVNLKTLGVNRVKY